MSQLDLLNYRRNDPATSREAGERATEFIDGDHADILKALRQLAVPLAAEQISDHLKWSDHVRVNRRLKELERADRIERTEQRHTNRSGRSAFKYQLKVINGTTSS